MQRRSEAVAVPEMRAAPLLAGRTDRDLVADADAAEPARLLEEGNPSQDPPPDVALGGAAGGAALGGDGGVFK